MYGAIHRHHATVAVVVAFNAGPRPFETLARHPAQVTGRAFVVTHFVNGHVQQLHLRRDTFAKLGGNYYLYPFP